MTVRTRIAPSPTGDPHVGTAYIALFNLAFARSQGGQFILRIEDTDQVRSTAAAEEQILASLRWLGLEWDEGPDVGGEHGPYRQSERSAIYREHCDRLLADGHAFHCFCTSERLDALRQEQMANKQQPGYDGHCMHLPAAEVEQRMAAGEAHVVRMKVPAEGTCTVQDRLRGEISIDWAQIDMQVLMKADGLPTYHLANVVDDHLMGITHVIRGEEWINSAPKHLLLYQYFGWDAPELTHMPLLRNPDKSKLSKRKNPTSINYYRRQGFLPEALVNYLARMGWSLGDQEKFTLAEMISAFSIDTVSLGGPIFDLEKLKWLNGEYLRGLDADAYAAAVAGYTLEPAYLRQILPLVQERAETLAELAPQVDYLLGDRRALAPEDFAHKQLEQADIVRILQFVTWELEQVADWQRGALHDAVSGLAERMGLKVRDALFPLFLAISGRPVCLPLYDSMAILGRDLVRARIRDAIDVLGGVGKKVAKRLDKEYAAL